QQGPQYGFDNVKEYVRWRDGFKCQHCYHKGGSDTKLEVHHVIQRKDGGSDRPDNLVTLCHDCHAALHRGEFTLRKPKGGYKAPTFMGVMRIKLVERLKAGYGDMVHTTFGYITRIGRKAAGLTKDHNTDARAISGNAEAKPDDAVWRIAKHRCHNRRLHREVPAKHGRRQAAQAARRVLGFGLHDRVAVAGSGQTCRVSGLRTSGYFALRTLNDNTMLNLNCSRLRLLERAGGLIMVPSASSSS
ncbi:MAG: HNH endonuclease, partial [Bullifex sp.]|nr:HNH endonuclease [Bullifex sp.]